MVPVAEQQITRTAAVRRHFSSPLRYPGGKSKAIRSIHPMLPGAVREYREPMLGGGSVFFHARSLGLARKYWINDLFADLYLFWRTVQQADLCDRLADELEALRAGFANAAAIKAYFYEMRNSAADDPYEIARRFFFFNRVTFSGTTRAGGFSSEASLRRFTASSIARLRPLPEALDGVKITNFDFEKVIKARGDDVFIFLDPPYYTVDRLYGHDGALHAFDHDRLAGLLEQTPHRFLITYDDCEEIRAMYRWAKIVPWTLQYGMSNCNKQNLSKRGNELFIFNYELETAG